MTREWVVYRLFDADDVLIYVGCTSDLEERMRHHRHTRPWWQEVVRIDVTEAYPDKQSGWAAERAAIIAAQPRHNVRHVGGGHEDESCRGGSYAGYARHRSRGEVACDACQGAKNQYVREGRLRAKATA